MKHIIFLIFLISILTPSLSQEKVKRIVLKHKSPHYTETYHVLKSNKEVKQGSYERSLYSGDILEKGMYDNNIKVGVWEYFTYNNKIQERGQFNADNKKIGTWEYYTYEEKLEQKYNHSTFKVEFSEENHDLKYKRIKDGLPEYVELDSNPLFIGGLSRIFRSTASSLRYPAEARRSGVQGKVIISIEITADGEQINEKVISGIGAGCDDEALRIMKLVPNDWVPATLNGKPVNIVVEFPVTFKLS